MTRNKNWLFGSYFETEQHLLFFFQNCHSPYIYGANFTAKFHRESGFLGGSMEPPWAPMGVKVPWSLKC